jgi:hypothetical protein
LAPASSAAARCPNTCAALASAAAARESARQAGLRARKQLEARAAQRAPTSVTRAAPHTAFRALDGACFESSTSEYKYELCLYTSATQSKSHGGPSLNLGRSWSWRKRAHGAPIVGVLGGGDMCAGAHVARSLVVTFACATADEARASRHGLGVLGKVSEASTCVYEVVLRTPAACE